MVGRVLRNNGIVTRDHAARSYELIGATELSDHERAVLIELCRQKVEAFLAERGDRPMHHRRQSDGYIPGTLRYNALKSARCRRELCGIPADEKALEVDYIVPRNKGGPDDRANLRALCYSCNATKRDHDDTDFRTVRRGRHPCPDWVEEPSTPPKTSTPRVASTRSD